MLVGYMRVSTAEQNLALQRDALRAAGCKRVCDDTCSGSVTDRPGLTRALDALRDGDALVVRKLDRIGRSLAYVVDLVGSLPKRGVGPAWLVTEKVLLPGASALERLIARIHARAGRRLWRALSGGLTREQRVQLDALLIAGDGGRPSPLDRLRDGPFMRSGTELTRVVARLDGVRLLTAGLPGTAHVPPGRVTALARFATVAKAQAVARLPEERRMATLLAFVRTLEASAQDDVLDLFDIVMSAVHRRGRDRQARAPANHPRS